MLFVEFNSSVCIRELSYTNQIMFEISYIRHIGDIEIAIGQDAINTNFEILVVAICCVNSVRSELKII